MADAGINHVLSVSGLHLSAAALVFYGLFRFLLGPLVWLWPFSARRWAALTALLPVAAYAWLTGALNFNGPLEMS